MSLALWNGFITAGYSSGHIRLFDLSLGILKVEICAHSRCINSLDIALETGLVSFVFLYMHIYTTGVGCGRWCYSPVRFDFFELQY